MILIAPKKYMPLAVLLMLLLAIAGIVWYGMLPLRESIGEKMKNIQEFYAGRENRERQVNKLPELEGQYNVIVANEKTLDILIMEDEVVDFVKIVEGLASETNVVMSITSKDGGKIIESKKPAAKTDQADTADQGSAAKQSKVPQKAADILDAVPFDRYLSLSVMVEGRYDNIVAFLGKLETLPFGLDVIKVEMKKKDAENDAQSRPARTATNPFAIFGDGTDVAEAVPPAAEKDVSEAVFDVLVYVKKTGL